MNVLSRTISGLVLILGGIALIVLALVNSLKDGFVVLLIYGIPILIIGLFILFNTSEDKIEKIKLQRRKK